ncbi:protein FAR1-RELATED SEQUENCE 5-like protein [Carex littledalei]|uniref:Protein FAR1-RELATED SEQUENCE 5-like protein n=1 Tax=Carex littledalei TaxID=544730 RepID=A0A833R682_9POAL|nr:protein FAR1-RELATED SEQUENCE 5-like protein [Carex littledalei]
MDLHQQAHQHPLMEANVDLEDESINFWATLGVTPHVPVVDLPHQITHQPLPQKQHIDPSDPPQPPPALPVATRGPHGLQGFMVPQKKQERLILGGCMKRSGSPASLTVTDDDTR